MLSAFAPARLLAPDEASSVQVSPPSVVRRMPLPVPPSPPALLVRAMPA
jgi:hypothetical protein